MKHTILFLFLALSRFLSGQSNVGFETWDSVFTSYHLAELTSFGVPNPLGGKINKWKGALSNNIGIGRTTDSYAGSYSAIIHNVYQYGNTTITYKNSINFKPAFLQGRFKYIPGAVDSISQGTAMAILTRFNGISCDTIAKGAFLFSYINTFTPFQLPLNYLSALNPDSITITIRNANKDCADQTMVCNLLYLDDFVLTNSPLGILDTDFRENMISVFPNPTNAELNFRNNSSQTIQFSLFNSLGEKIVDRSLPAGASSMVLSDYPGGIYVYKIFDQQNRSKTGKVVKN